MTPPAITQLRSPAVATPFLSVRIRRMTAGHSVSLSGDLKRLGFAGD